MNHKRVSSFHYGLPDEHISLLGKAGSLMPLLSNNARLLNHSKPVIWHKDLHMGNIFVSETDQTIIQCLIDWQATFNFSHVLAS
jgi:Phosphotransferase enzyme family